MDTNIYKDNFYGIDPERIKPCCIEKGFDQLSRYVLKWFERQKEILTKEELLEELKKQRKGTIDTINLIENKKLYKKDCYGDFLYDRYSLQFFNDQIKILEDAQGRPKASRKPKGDWTFLKLFDSNEKMMNRVISIMKTHQYLTNDEKWNDKDFQPGELLPIINYLETLKITKPLSNKSMLARIWNNRIGFVMDARLFRRDQPKTYKIDPKFAEKLENLIK